MHSALQSAFDDLDQTHRGFITAKEIVLVVGHFNIKIKKQEIKEYVTVRAFVPSCHMAHVRMF
jgi:Ca2+-binding EF-hand superfamily protein